MLKLKKTVTVYQRFIKTKLFQQSLLSVRATQKQHAGLYTEGRILFFFQANAFSYCCTVAYSLDKVLPSVLDCAITMLSSLLHHKGVIKY